MHNDPLSLFQLHVQVVQAVKSGKYPFIMCNFAPPDMVGHTGVYDAAVIACAATGERMTSYYKIIVVWSTHALMYAHVHVQS